MAEPSKQVVEALEKAVAAVTKAKVPKDLREIAFTAALGSLGSQGVPPVDPPPGGPPPPPPPADLGDGISKIANALELDATMVGLVFDVEDEEVAITVKRDRFDDTAKVAQQEVTYLIVAARQAVGLEDWTTAKKAIEATHDRGVHDTNVSKAISALDGDGIRFKGGKGSRELKMNAVGFAKAADIVKRLTDER